MKMTVSEQCVKYEDVLPANQNADIFALAIASEASFLNSSTYGDNKAPGSTHSYRKSVTMKKGMFDSAKHIFEKLTNELLDEVCRGLGLEPFAIQEIELGMTAHNDGDYYLWHQDTYNQEVRPRVISFVYYFHKLPKPYSGGELAIYPKNLSPEVIVPQNNMMVFFRSGDLHEVRKIVNPGAAFENCRFSVHGFIRRKTEQ